MKINKYVDIETLGSEAKKDYIDRHSPFIHTAATAKKGEKLEVKVVMGKEYKHPDDFDHYISTMELWDGETLLGRTEYAAGSQSNAPVNQEVSFFIVPSKNLKLIAQAVCTKHGLWQSDEVLVEVQ